MPIIQCPRIGCDYSTGEQEAVIAAALLNAHSTVHTGPGGGGGNTRAPPVERPKVTSACPLAEWEVFKSRWRSFKLATNIVGDKKVHQLLGCLDSDVANLVYNEHSSPEELTEEDLLELIQKVAVKPENVWVTREKLHTMQQDQGEPVTGFAARLRGQARLCKFCKSITCSAEGCDQEVSIDFTDEVVM